MPKQSYILVPLLLIGILQTGTFIIYNKNTDTAVDRIVRVLRIDPHYSADYYGGERIIPFTAILTNVYRRDKEGSDFLVRRTASSKSNIADIIQLAYQYFNQKNYQKALEYLNKVPPQILNIEKKAKYCYAATLFKLNDYQKSSEALSELARDTSFGRLYYLLSGAMQIQGNNDSAFSAAMTGLIYTEDTVKYVSELFNNIYSNKNYDLALRIEREAYSLRPDESDFILCLGMSYQALNQSDSAGKYFNLTLQQDSTNINAMLGMIYVLYDKGKYPEALNRLDHLDQLHPQNADIKYWTAKVLGKLGREREAFDACAEALHLSPNHIPARILGAQKLYSAGAYLQAAEQFSQILLLNQNDPDALLGLAKSNDKMGNGTEAWRYLKRWKELRVKTEVDSETATLLKKYDFND